jgi:hypothetical protein
MRNVAPGLAQRQCPRPMRIVALSAERDAEPIHGGRRRARQPTPTASRSMRPMPSTKAVASRSADAEGAEPHAQRRGEGEATCASATALASPPAGAEGESRAEADNQQGSCEMRRRFRFSRCYIAPAAIHKGSLLVASSSRIVFILPVCFLTGI